MFRRAFAAILFGILAAAASAQQIQYLDLAGRQPEEFRRPAPGVMGYSCGFCDHCPKSKHPTIEIAVLSLSPSSIIAGEEITFRIRIRNTSDMPAKIPWAMDPKEVEPVDNINYKYVQLSLDLILTLPDEKSRNTSAGPDFVSVAQFYASPNVEQHFLTLKPGEWVELNQTAKYYMGNAAIAELLQKGGELNFTVKGNATISDVQHIVAENKKPAKLQSVCNNDVAIVGSGDLKLTVVRRPIE